MLDYPIERAILTWMLETSLGLGVAKVRTGYSANIKPRPILQCKDSLDTVLDNGDAIGALELHLRNGGLMFVTFGFAKAGPKPSQVMRTDARNNNHCTHSTPCAKTTTLQTKFRKVCALFNLGK